MATRLSFAYLALAAAYLLLFDYNASWPGAFVKILPILLLAYGSCRLAAAGWRRSMTIALLLSALGDFLLALNGMTGNLFAAGLGSFLLAQLAYAQLFWRHRSADGRRRLLAAACLPAAGALAWFIVPAAGDLAPAVAIYLLAITAMLTGAALAERPVALVFAGAFSFAFSDAVIAVNKFITPVPSAGLIIMLSYYAAQWLIWRGALRGGGPGR
jgi:uncharacterized membrane protein YhhN